MDAKELKEKLSEYDIKNIMKSLGGIIFDEDDEKIIYNTICHCGDSPNKLYYFKETENFYCFTHCGALDIISIVSEVKDFSMYQSIQYICVVTGISDVKYGFTDDRIKIINDWSFINSYKRNYEKLNTKDKEVDILNKNILNLFQKYYTYEWLNEGISEYIMEQYNILYSTLRQSIIIPHYNVNNQLIGVRQRAMLDIDIKNYGKYTPFSIGNTMYNHPLGTNLYGIHKNKDTIKKLKKAMLIEGEKSVLQCASMFGIENNFTLALCGCAKISKTQLNLLLSLGVKEVIIGLDKQYKIKDSKEYMDWISHLKTKIINPLLPYFKVYVLWDTEDLLEYKDSPTDKGKDVLLKLMKNKIYIPS